MTFYTDLAYLLSAFLFVAVLHPIFVVAVLHPAGFLFVAVLHPIFVVAVLHTLDFLAGRCADLWIFLASGVAVLGFLGLPARLVEVAIAVSILVLAVELARGEDAPPSPLRRVPWAMASLCTRL